MVGGTEWEYSCACARRITYIIESTNTAYREPPSDDSDRTIDTSEKSMYKVYQDP
jgi:hypothetical protein